ncbi:MAG: hypothetical protein WC869_01250 [Phycisphaerae bacterium]|jgi:hypothetical protein
MRGKINGPRWARFGRAAELLDAAMNRRDAARKTLEIAENDLWNAQREYNNAFEAAEKARHATPV